MTTPIDTLAPRFICRCEEILLEDVVAAIAEGAGTINDLKRRTRAGMGVCQGIYCVPTMTDLIHRQAGIPLEAIAPMTARPPVRLVPLGLLAVPEE